MSADTDRGALHLQKEKLSISSGKDPSCPGDPTRGMSAHETFHLCGSHGCKRPLVPPSQCFGVPNYIQQPKPGPPARGRTWLGTAYLGGGREGAEGGPSSRALTWPLRRKQSLEGHKRKTPHEVSPIPWGQGMENKGGIQAGVTVSSPVPPGGGSQEQRASHPAAGWKDEGGRQPGPPGSRHREGAPPPRHRHEPPTTELGRGPLFRSRLHISVRALASYRE